MVIVDKPQNVIKTYISNNTQLEEYWVILDPEAYPSITRQHITVLHVLINPRTQEVEAGIGRVLKRMNFGKEIQWNDLPEDIQYKINKTLKEQPGWEKKESLTAMKKYAQPKEVVGIYDAGDTYADRYTVLLEKGFWETTDYDLYPAFGLSDNPEHPSMGFSQAVEAKKGSNLGKEISWEDLPEKVQAHVINRLKEDDDTVLESLLTFEKESKVGSIEKAFDTIWAFLPLDVDSKVFKACEELESLLTKVSKKPSPTWERVPLSDLALFSPDFADKVKLFRQLFAELSEWQSVGLTIQEKMTPIAEEITSELQKAAKDVLGDEILRTRAKIEDSIIHLAQSTKRHPSVSYAPALKEVIDKVNEDVQNLINSVIAKYTKFSEPKPSIDFESRRATWLDYIKDISKKFKNFLKAQWSKIADDADEFEALVNEIIKK